MPKPDAMNFLSRVCSARRKQVIIAPGVRKAPSHFEVQRELSSTMS